MVIALCYASLCLANQARHIRSATRRLSDELQWQNPSDGGHISRNPGALIELLIDPSPLRQTFAARNIAPPPALLNAIDRMMPTPRFFCHGDGSFAPFKCMSNAPSDRGDALLAYDDTHGVPMANMPHTGFQRLEARAMSMIMRPRAAAAEYLRPGRPCGLPVIRIIVRAKPDREVPRTPVDRGGTIGACLRAAGPRIRR